MHTFEPIETERLILRPPEPMDAAALFEFASSAPVTKYMAWPRHLNLNDTLTFLAFSRQAWDRWPAGPLLIQLRSDGTVIGSTGLDFETRHRASTGYILTEHAWGQGFATEALRATAELARRLEVRRLYAHCHVEHAASARVLERANFEREGILRNFAQFPNLNREAPQDVFLYARTW